MDEGYRLALGVTNGALRDNLPPMGHPSLLDRERLPLDLGEVPAHHHRALSAEWGALGARVRQERGKAALLVERRAARGGDRRPR